jgi:hypothetical protein
MSIRRDKLIEQAGPILEHYRTRLVVERKFDAAEFEKDLRSLWQIGYQELKPRIIEIGKDDRYREVAAYYMERINAPVVVSEFKPFLAELYGLASYDVPEREGKKAEFWSGVFANEQH